MTKQQEVRGAGDLGASETVCSYFGLTAEQCAEERGTEWCDKHSGGSEPRPEVRRAPGEIIRSVRFRSNGQSPITVGLSLVVLDEDVPGATTTIAGDSIGELRALAHHLGLRPVVTWSNSRVVVHHAARTQGRDMTNSETKSALTVEEIAAMGVVKRLGVAKQEAAAVKEAKRRGDSEMPSTPVLDYMNGTEYREMQAKQLQQKQNRTRGTGKAVNFDEAELRSKCVDLLAAGHTTKAAMLKALRAEGKGARQQRFYPIADAVIAEAKKNGTFPKAAPAKKAATKKAATKKAAPAKSTAKKAAPAKKVTTNFKATAAATKKRTSTARVRKTA